MQSLNNYAATGWNAGAFKSFVISSLVCFGKYSSISIAFKGGALGAVTSTVDSVVYPHLYPYLKNQKICDSSFKNDVAKLSVRVFVVLTIVAVGASLLNLHVRIGALVFAGFIKIAGYFLFKAVSAFVTLPSPAFDIREWFIGNCDRSGVAIPYPFMVF